MPAGPGHPGFPSGLGVQALALDYIREQDFRERTRSDDSVENDDESLAWSTWLMEQRRKESRQTTQSYEAVLSLALLLLRRRPKPGYSVARIVRADQSLWIGGIHRAFLLPDEYPEYGSGAPPSPVSPVTGLPEGNGQIEQAMVDLIIGMIEESLFSINSDRLESRLIIAGDIVSLDDLIEETGANSKFVHERYPSDLAFASGCLQWLAGEWEGFGQFALQFRAAAKAGVEALLEWVGSVHRDFPALLGAARFEQRDPAFDEIVAFIAVVLSRTSLGVNGSVSPDDLRRARRCVEAAARGGDWRTFAGLPPHCRADAGHPHVPA